MKCRSCGAENPDGVLYCEACGTPFENAPQNQSQQNSNGYYNTQQPTYNKQQYYQQAPPNQNQNYYQTGQPMQVISPCNRWLAFIFCLFLGYIGIHRFYVGKIGTGLLYVFTCGLFGIGSLVDLILIAMGSFTDSAGLILKE